MAARRALSSLSVLILIALPGLAREGIRPAAPRPGGSAATAAGLLRDGVVLDPERGALYAMAPGGGIVAIRTVDGAVLWESREGARPLTLAGPVLVVEDEGAPRATSLRLTLLDVAARGRLLGRIEAPLAAPTRTLVDDGLGAGFRMQATAGPTGAVALWQAARREVPGALPAGAEGPAALAVEASVGGFALDLPGRTATPIEVAAFPEPRYLREVPEAARLPGSGPQYLSADGRTVAASERVARDPEWNRYRWSVREAATGRVVGTFDHFTAIAPFVVDASTLVLETRPFQRRTPAGSYLRQPLSLRGIDLETGREIWARPIRDVTYYGPFPP